MRYAAERSEERGVSRRAQGMPIQTIGIIVLIVIVIVAVAVFFFAGLSEQGAVMGQTSEATVGNLKGKLDVSLACIPPVNCCGVGETPLVDFCCDNPNSCPTG